MNQVTFQELHISDKLKEITMEPGFTEIIEWTFMYDDASIKNQTPYNTTFFQEIGMMSYDEWKVDPEINSQTLINTVRGTFGSWIRELSSLRDVIADTEKGVLEKEAIDYIITSIETASFATPIELEKAGHGYILSSLERDQLVEKIELGQTKLYGGKISENPNEVLMSLELLCKDFLKGKSEISEEDTLRFQQIYISLTNRIGELFPDMEIPLLDTFSQKDIQLHPSTVEILDRVKAIRIPREEYMHLFQMYIDSMGFHQKVVIKPGASSVYDGPNELGIPSSSQYDALTLKRVIELMIHEVSVHYVNQKTSEQNGFIIRGANNVEKEEGLAMICEGLFNGNKLSNLKIAGVSFPFILAGELLSENDRKEFIDIYFKLGTNPMGDMNKIRDRRIMRGYPFAGPGAQRKDMSYGRGANRIIQYLQDGKCNFVDLFSGKFGIDDIASGRISKLIPREHVTFPLLFPEMLFFSISLGDQRFSHEKFMEYMKEKYGEVLGDSMNDVNMITSITQLRAFIKMNKLISPYLPK